MSGCSPCGPTIAGQPGGGGGMGPPGPPGPPGPSGGCANTVIVEAADPFATLPAPVAGEINLLPDTLYKFCGAVDVGPNTLVLPPSSVAAGDDPLVDSVRGSAGTTIECSGGTIKDLAIAQTSLGGSAVRVLGAWQDCVLWNLSTASPGGRGVFVTGFGTFLSIARILDRTSDYGIRFGDGDDTASVVACNIDNQVYAPDRLLPGIGVSLSIGSRIQNLALTESAISIGPVAGIGYELLGAITTLRVASCAFDGSGTPSIVAQPGALPPGTTGSAVQGEAVGCVGFDNSQQRGTALVANALTVIPAPGVFVPVGGAATPLFVLSPSAVRVSLQPTVGAQTDNQFLQFDRIAPYSADIQVSLSVQVAAGFAFTPRVIVSRLLINGAPSGAFAATTPDFSTAAPVSLSYGVGATLQGGDTVQLEIANVTDASNLDVVAAGITIT